MAVDAFCQAVLFCADAFMHGRIPLIENIVHVVLTHVPGRFNATLRVAVAALGLGDERTRGILVRACISCHAGRVNAKQQAE